MGKTRAAGHLFWRRVVVAVQIFLILLLLLVILTAVLAAGSFALFQNAVRRGRRQRAAEPDALLPPPESYEGKRRRQTLEAEKLRESRRLQPVEILSADGLRLRGNFLASEQPTRKIVLSVHGYRCSGLREWGLFAGYYHRRGYHLLMPDNRAHGASEGRYIGFGWLDRLDILRWCGYLCERFGPDCEILLHGISMGAATVLMAGGEAQLPSQVKGIVADCGFTCAWDELRYRMRADFRFKTPILLWAADKLCQKRAGYRLKEASALEQVKHCTTPVLFIHGDADTYVPTEMVYELYAACSAPKTLFIQRGAIHANSYLTSPEKYEKALEEFFGRIGF